MSMKEKMSINISTAKYNISSTLSPSLSSITLRKKKWRPTIPDNTILVLQTFHGKLPKQNDLSSELKAYLDIGELNLFIADINEAMEDTRLSRWFMCFLYLICFGMGYYLWLLAFPLIYNFPLWSRVLGGFLFGGIVGTGWIRCFNYCLLSRLVPSIVEVVQEYNEDRRFVREGEWEYECYGRNVFLYLVLPDDASRVMFSRRVLKETATIIQDSSNDDHQVPSDDEKGETDELL